MNVIPTEIPEVLEIIWPQYGDERGWLGVLHEQSAFAELGIPIFTQDNVSSSVNGVLRGLHWQVPVGQGKLVSVLNGRIFDVAVDLRNKSGRWVGRELSLEKHNQLYIPPGFAHGFLVLSETATVYYKNTASYIADGQCSLRWNEPRIGIEWPDVGVPIQVSPKDEAAWTWDTVPDSAWP